MGVIVETEGYDGYKKQVTALKGKSPVFVLFSGSKDSATGKSWCPDCVTAEPIVKECFYASQPDTSTLLYVQVGQRDYWKDMANDFRKDSDLRLTAIPTLIRWGGKPQKLVEEQLLKKDVVGMMFEEDD